MSNTERIEHRASFGGWQDVYRHRSEVLGCDMTVGVYFPPQAGKGEKLPVLYWLSGLTCKEQNFITNAGAQRYAAENWIIIAAMTSPTTRPMTWARAPASTSTPPAIRGRSTTACTTTSWKSCRRGWNRTRRPATCAPSAATPWAATAR